MSKNADSLFFGWGGEWTQVEAQLIFDILKRNVPDLIGKQRVTKGDGYIHGLLEKEEVIRFPFEHANGHTLITGASGSGKTKCFEILLKQLILRNEVVIYLDPKGDKDIRNVAAETCEMMGQADKYIQWHPAFPRESIRLNPLKNFARSSELAARVTALVPEDGDSFYRDIANTVVQYIVDASHMINEQVTLTGIRYYYEHFAKLLEKTCIAWFDTHDINWRDKIFKTLESSVDEEFRALLCVSFYRKNVANEHHNPTIESMASMYIDKRKLLEQSTTNLLANLQKVSTGGLAEMLSPSDMDDPRQIYDMESIIKTNKCLIIGTDSLADRIVSSALGKMILADAAAVAANRYNYDENSDKVINIFVDEASEMLCEPLIQMINKSRGAKFRLFIATQTISDLTAELGSEAKADQIIASTNNYISFRCNDLATQERVCAKNPPTRVKYVMRTQGFNASNDDINSLTANIGERLMEEEVELFPKELLSKLPDLEFIASFAGGRLKKGRLPILGKPKKAS
ncbi:conjugative transfer system coupling protein TraD [Psychromonas aquimarina]|uniref:conjugative transfer system coupling protein TraD n=1 Tax=Psychromonas aquimarina TaxID=444919 RepID=UPI0003FE1E8F|nr:conjugative transfer system coupling protein TraD [Psychromonas aquimarina]